MSRVVIAIQDLYLAEQDLAGALQTMAQRHRDDHEVFHLGRDLAEWSTAHVGELAHLASDRGMVLEDPVPDDTDEATGRRGVAERRHRDDPSMRLLEDLRDVHRQAAGVSLDWEVLAQTAQALKDADLLAVCQRAHPDTLRQMRWANAMLKEASAQVMVSG